MKLSQFQKIAAPRWKIVRTGPFNYVIHLRSFAPWDWFGAGQYEGDNRTFSTREDVTSRIRMEVGYSLKEKNVLCHYTESDWSVGMKAVGPIPTGVGVMKGQPRSTVRCRKGDNGSTEIQSSYAGNLPLVKGSPDINVDATFHFTELMAPGRGKLGVKVRVTGDDFPLFESFIRDDKGQRLFLCTSRPKSALFGRSFGPLFALPGNRGRFMASADLAISVDEQGNFSAVDDRVVDLAKPDTWKKHSDPKSISVQTWNEYFTTRDWL